MPLQCRTWGRHMVRFPHGKYPRGHAAVSPVTFSAINKAENARVRLRRWHFWRWSALNQEISIKVTVRKFLLVVELCQLNTGALVWPSKQGCLNVLPCIGATWSDYTQSRSNHSGGPATTGPPLTDPHPAPQTFESGGRKRYGSSFSGMTFCVSWRKLKYPFVWSKNRSSDEDTQRESGFPPRSGRHGSIMCLHTQ